MLEILYKGSFFVCMLVLSITFTSITLTSVIVVGFLISVSLYYYSSTIRRKIDEYVTGCRSNPHIIDASHISPVSNYITNRKYKMNNNIVTGVENSELPSPILKANSAIRTKSFRDKLKINLNPKDIARKPAPMYAPLSQPRRYNANLDLETYMNVNSPGFTSRVIDKASESSSYKYSSSRQQSYKFDKSSLRQLSKVPRSNTTPVVRIAAPETLNVELLPPENNIGENGENIRGNNILQVLKDMSRKRNYSQEETDRSGTIPKKSKKSEIRATTTQHKRTHDECSNDSIEEDLYRKKRCEESNNNIVKMMSYTSGMSILGHEDFIWGNQSKKRKSSRLEKSKNESPEKSEKCRKISEIPNRNEQVPEVVEITEKPEEKDSKATSKILPESESVIEKKPGDVDKKDAADCVSINDSSFIDEDSDIIHIAVGKLLNRSNCLYRRKLNSSKIDPVSLINSEPELAKESSNDDEILKENLLANLVKGIEKYGERNDSVIFYHNSIAEEIAKNVVVEVEVHQPPTWVHTSSSIKPLKPVTAKPPSLQITSPALSLPDSELEDISASVNKSNPLLDGVSGGLKFVSQTIDAVDSSNGQSELHSSQNPQEAAVKCPKQPSVQNSADVVASPKIQDSPTVIQIPTVSASFDALPSMPPTLNFQSSVPAQPFTKLLQDSATAITTASTTCIAQPTASSSAFTTAATVSSTGFASFSSSGFAFGTISKSTQETNPLVTQQKSTSPTKPEAPLLIAPAENPGLNFTASATTAPAATTNMMFGSTTIGSPTVSPNFGICQKPNDKK